MWAYVACFVFGAVLAIFAYWVSLRTSHERRSLNRTLRQKSIPRELLGELADARTCFNARAYTATVVMVRRTLEAFCATQGYEGQSLHKSLKAMEEDGRLDPAFCKWAHDLRVLGNEGAHFTGKPVKRNDASDALGLARALLEYRYVLTAQYEQFVRRRQDEAVA